MHHAVKRFASRVVLAHAAALLVLLAVVFFASREVYERAREQALAQARERQELLASQTAHALQNFYGAILSDLELLRPANPDDPDSDYVAPRRPTTRPMRVVGAAGPRGIGVAPLLSQQLDGRISYLFTLDKNVDKPTFRPRWIGIGAEESVPPVSAVAARCASWARSLDQPAISPFQRFGDYGLSLVGIPIGLGVGGGSERASVLVAGVSARRLEHLFLEDLNNRSTGGAFLIDDAMTIMTALRTDLIGADVAASGDAEIREFLASLPQTNYRGSAELKRSFSIGPERFRPALITAEPVRVGEKRWLLMLASPLGDVDSVMRDLFRRVLWWALFLGASLTAVLVSTAVQLIRGRLRLEGVRHELLARELKQARLIQLAWLPAERRPPGGGGGGGGAADGRQGQGRLDIASVNEPASHISGDFYNYFDLPDGRTVVAIGDVTGHGIAAAFLMATTQLLVRTTMPRVADPGSCLTEVNRQLCVQVFNGQFVTMQVLVLDVERQTLQVATAGHPPPLVSDGESYQPLPLEPQLVLGVDVDATYPTETFPLPPEGGILLYTDGVVDVEQASRERFGFDRLRRALYGRFPSAQAMLEKVLVAANQFRGGYDLHDDLTLVAIQLQPGHTREKPHPQPATA